MHPTVPLKLCTGNCGPCLVPGTTFHKLLISYRSDKLQEQEVMRDPIEKGRIPMQIFDIIDAHRIARMKGSPPKDLPDNVETEILINTGKAKYPHISARCATIHGKSFTQLGTNFTVLNGRGVTVPYKMKDLKYDLDNGYLKLQEFVQHIADKRINNQLRLQMYQETAFIYSAQIASGQDPITEREADASPDAAEWHKAKQIELEGLDKLNCWHYIDECDVPRNEQIFNGKFVFKWKAPANGMPGKYKARWCISNPKFLQRLSDKLFC